MGCRDDWDRGDGMSSMRSWHESLPKQSELRRLAGNSGSGSRGKSRGFKYTATVAGNPASCIT